MVQIKGIRNSEHHCTRPQAGTCTVLLRWRSSFALQWWSRIFYWASTGWCWWPFVSKGRSRVKVWPREGKYQHELCCWLQMLFGFLQTLSPACLPKVVTLVVATTFMPTPPSAEYRHPSVADPVLPSTLTRHVIQSGSALSIARSSLKEEYKEST